MGGDSELFGVTFSVIGAAATAFEATVPLEGEWWINEVVLLTGSDPAAEPGCVWRFGARSLVPSSVAEMDSAEPLFPGLPHAGVKGPVLKYATLNAVVRVRGRFRFAFKGRRLVVSFQNVEAPDISGTALFVMERVPERG